ncbi:MAG: hypothetical protein J6N71_03065 [Muribaculaceae bacterium]|nr:hypothetical protein [Muribaculaceae bacterium]
MTAKEEILELIAALRTEVEVESVSPERVGYVLQRMVDLFPSASMQVNAIKGYVAITSVDELPESPTVEQQQQGWLLGTVLYVYVGEGGDTLEGKWQSAQLKGEDGAPGAQGPAGADGRDGVSLGDVVLVNDLTTGGEGNALSAEMGKVLNEKTSFTESFAWGGTTGSSGPLGTYAWPVFRPLDKACKVTKMYVNEEYAQTLQSDTGFALYVAELNEAKTVYTLTSKVVATLAVGESSIDLDIDLPANSSLFVTGANQSNFMLLRGTLPDDDAYPQVLANTAFIAVGKTYTANSSYSKRAWGVKFDYLISSDIKSFVLAQSERIDSLENDVDVREVTYDRPTILLATGSSLTDTHEAYKGGAWLDILNDMVDVVIVNTGKSGASRQNNFQRLVSNGGISHDGGNTIGKLRPTYVMVFNTANMSGDNAVGVGALPDLEYGLNIVRTIGGQLILASELAMFHSGKEFDQTYTSFCRKHNLLVSPYCHIASKLISNSPYTGFNNGVHEGYRGKSYALAHYDLLKILPIRKSIKMFAVRPDYQGGSPTYDQLIYDTNEERFVKFHAIKAGEGRWQGTKHVDNVNSDSTTYDTATGTDTGQDGTLGEGSSFTSILQRGGAVTFNNFALCEVILDRINCSKGEFRCVCSANPSAVYIATNKSSFATPMSEWTLVEHTYVVEGNFTWVKFSINRSGKDFQAYDKVRILICGSGDFTIARPSFSGYDGDLKPDLEPLRDYHIRQYSAELLAKTSCEDGWTMGGNASVQSLPTEIANYSGYNNVKSHIELASDSDYCTKSVAITQPCSKVAVRVVANLFPKIATSLNFCQMTDAQKAKYISTTPTIAEYGYNFGTLRVSLGGGAVKDFTMWPGWFEYYQVVDVAPTDTSLTLKIERLLAKDGITTNSDFNVFVHDVSVQKIG